MKQLSTLFLIITLLAIFGACQKQEKAPVTEESTKEEIIKSDVVKIIDSWIRPGSAGTNTALFFKAYNNTGKQDTLYGASSDLARKVEVHETYKAENDMMGMRHVDFVVIPVGDTVIFRPRSLHVMMMGLYNDVLVGDSGNVTLMFKNSGDITVTGIIRDMPSMK